MAIETAHLRLLPYAPGHLLALIEGVQPFERTKIDGLWAGKPTQREDG
jgi:hypothetical protein